MKYSYVTVITNSNYYPGLCSLAYSLRCVKSRYPLSVVIPRTMDSETKALIYSLKIQVIEVEDVDLSNVPLANNMFQRWNFTFLKLRVFGLMQFDKIVFLDSDMIVIKNIDELFEKEHMSCVAAGYCAHKDWTRLNSGLMVIVPNQAEYDRMVAKLQPACEERVKMGVGFGDQDVINYCYPNWFNQKELVLSEVYNAMSCCIHPLASEYGYKNVKVIHFAENPKPWQYSKKAIPKIVVSDILHGYVLRARILMLYCKYLKKSCPNYHTYN